LSGKGYFVEDFLFAFANVSGAYSNEFFYVFVVDWEAVALDIFFVYCASEPFEVFFDALIKF
jgi:hypothetical protein